MEKIKMDIGFAVIVAELVEAEGIQPELCIYLEDESGYIVQDIMLVRQAIDKYDNPIKAIECLVWKDKDSEDYTNRFVIEKYEEKEQ